MNADLIVIGSGPGGCSAAIAAARKGMRVLVLERGDEVRGYPATGSKPTIGQQAEWFARIQDNAPRAVGGGSAINYGVVATPTLDDLTRALGASNVARVLRSFPGYMQAISSKSMKASTVLPETNLIGMALARKWNLSRAVDQSGGSSSEPVAAPRSTNVNQLLYPASLQVPFGLRGDYSSIASDVRLDISIQSLCEVECIRSLGCDGWQVVVKGMEAALRAPHVVVACGALETPRLLLRSVQCGGLPRGVSAHVGQHLLDHGRYQITLEARASPNALKHKLVNPLLARRVGHLDVHMELLTYEDIESCGINVLLGLVPCKPSTMFNLWSRCAVPIDDTCSTATFDPACCRPCGLSRLFNPFRYCAATFLVVVGAEYSHAGSVSVDAAGRRVTRLPQFSRTDFDILQAHTREMVDVCNETWPVKAAPPPCLEYGRDDTEWHHVGTARMDVQGDGAVNSNFVLLDAEQRPYATDATSLRVGDNSVARRPTVFNTKALAALIGYSAGDAVGAAHGPRNETMSR